MLKGGLLMGGMLIAVTSFAGSRKISPTAGGPDGNTPSVLSDFSRIGVRVVTVRTNFAPSWAVPLEVSNPGGIRSVSVRPYLEAGACATVFTYTGGGALFTSSGTFCAGSAINVPTLSATVPDQGAALLDVGFRTQATTGYANPAALATVEYTDPSLP
jgi:hypothetical protein